MLKEISYLTRKSHEKAQTDFPETKHEFDKTLKLVLKKKKN